QAGSTLHLIQAAIPENDFIHAFLSGQDRAWLLALHASDFKNVGKIGIKIEADGEFSRLGMIRKKTQRLDAAISMNRDASINMKWSAGTATFGRASAAIGVSQINVECAGIFANRGSQQQRLPLVDVQNHARQVPTLGVKEPEMKRTNGFDIA